MPHTKQLIIDLHPLALTLGGVSLVNTHEVLSNVVILLSGVYTCFKIYNDFFKNKNKK